MTTITTWANSPETMRSRNASRCTCIINRLYFHFNFVIDPTLCLNLVREFRFGFCSGSCSGSDSYSSDWPKNSSGLSCRGPSDSSTERTQPHDHGTVLLIAFPNVLAPPKLDGWKWHKLNVASTNEVLLITFFLDPLEQSAKSLP